MIGGFAAVLAVVVVPDASAQKRLSYEQAWAQCKKEVVAIISYAGWTQPMNNVEGLAHIV
jgi:hypothetical protein